jgi:hypothetical protein
VLTEKFDCYFLGLIRSCPSPDGPKNVCGDVYNDALADVNVKSPNSNWYHMNIPVIANVKGFIARDGLFLFLLFRLRCCRVKWEKE